MMLTVRVDDAVTRRLDRLAEALTKRAAGMPVTRAATMRLALEKGMEALETELGPKKKR
jgi:predicted transcriptional regulator